MHQLILGSNTVLRDKILGDLKARFFKTPDALKFDLSSLDAQGLGFNDLKAALLTVPAVASMRLILISRADKLDEQCLELIDSIISAGTQPCVVVLESQKWDRRHALRKRIAERMKVSGEAKAPSAFDLLDRLSGDRCGALTKLAKLLEDETPENFLGAVRWWWANKAKARVPAAKYKKGLLVIQEADQRIKLSGLLSKEQALEVVLVKLSSLLKV